MRSNYLPKLGIKIVNTLHYITFYLPLLSLFLSTDIYSTSVFVSYSVPKLIDNCSHVRQLLTCLTTGHVILTFCCDNKARRWRQECRWKQKKKGKRCYSESGQCSDFCSNRQILKYKEMVFLNGSHAISL